MKDDPLTKLELEFRAIAAGVQKHERWYVHPQMERWCREARARWEADHPEHVRSVMDKRFR